MNRSNETTHLPLGTKLGEYEIRDVLGQGGFGITYKAWDSVLACFVAIKEYFPKHLALRATDSISIRPITQGDAESYQRGLQSFVQEARVLAQFQHPGVVPVKRMVQANSTAYMVMGFVEGKSLSEIIKLSPERLSPNNVVKWTTQLLSALEKIHSAGLLHRDIKPSNIYIDEHGNAMLLDFGAARRVVAEASHSITGVVSAGYSPVEQYAETVKNQGPWTDIYSLSATLYRCVRGEKPKEATERRDAMDDDEDDPVIALDPAHFPSYPEGFIRAINLGMAVLRKKRPQSVAQFRVVMTHASASSETRPEAEQEIALKQGKDASSIALGKHRETSEPKPGRRLLNGLLSTVAFVAILAFVVRSDFFDSKWEGVDDSVTPRFDVALEITPSSKVSTVLIDGANVSDWRELSLAAGRHSVIINAKSGYKSIEASFVVDAQNTQFGWILSSSLVPFTLNVNPSNARIILPDLPADVTYYEGLELTPTKHRVRIVAQGYQTLEEIFDLSRQSHFDVQLVRNSFIDNFANAMIDIPAGSFRMGGTTYTDEEPIRTVNIGRFQLSPTEVTWGQYKRCIDADICSDLPVSTKQWSRQRPVTNVSWNDAQNFINYLNGLSSGGFRLPSEAEWEYAARAGERARYPGGVKLSCSDARFGHGDSGDSGVCNDGGANGPVEVASYQPNAFGIYDTIGNTLEWVDDCWYENYDNAPSNNTSRLGSAEVCQTRVMRGGGWAASLVQVAIPYRNSDNIDIRYGDVGFRVAR